jgi:hypothetical protein
MDSALDHNLMVVSVFCALLLAYVWEWAKKRKTKRANAMDKQRVIATFKKIRAKKMAGFVPSIDKIEWHRSTVRELGLPESAIFLPGGLILGWAIERGFTSAELDGMLDPDDIRKLRTGEISGPQLYELRLDRLYDRLFVESCFQFLRRYTPETYWEDLQKIMPNGESPYTLADTKESFSTVKQFLDRRYSEFTR